MERERNIFLLFQCLHKIGSGLRPCIGDRERGNRTIHALRHAEERQIFVVVAAARLLIECALVLARRVGQIVVAGQSLGADGVLLELELTHEGPRVSFDR